MAKKQTKNIGVPVASAPKEACTDEHCPYHGSLTVHGRQFEGMIVSAKVPKLATVEWERRVFIPKYERYLKRRSKVQAHNPPCVNAKLGDVVRIMECRPVSKTKNFVIIEILGRESLIQDILEGRERGADKKAEGKKKAAPKAAEEEKE